MAKTGEESAARLRHVKNILQALFNTRGMEFEMSEEEEKVFEHVMINGIFPSEAAKKLSLEEERVYKLMTGGAHKTVWQIMRIGRLEEQKKEMRLELDTLYANLLFALNTEEWLKKIGYKGKLPLLTLPGNKTILDLYKQRVISKKAYYALRSAQIETLHGLFRTTSKELSKYRNIGKSTIDELKQLSKERLYGLWV